MCLESDASGKINSMWGDEKAYMNEAANSFLLTLFSGKIQLVYIQDLSLGKIEQNELNLITILQKMKKKDIMKAKK